MKHKLYILHVEYYWYIYKSDDLGVGWMRQDGTWRLLADNGKMPKYNSRRNAIRILRKFYPDAAHISKDVFMIE